MCAFEVSYDHLGVKIIVEGVKQMIRAEQMLRGRSTMILCYAENTEHKIMCYKKQSIGIL
jgi:hypothetical protein